MHSGRTWVEDAPGGGARFVVEFPRDFDPKVATATPLRRAAVAGAQGA
jgi:hypothetical protein